MIFYFQIHYNQIVFIHDSLYKNFTFYFLSNLDKCMYFLPREYRILYFLPNFCRCPMYGEDPLPPSVLGYGMTRRLRLRNYIEDPQWEMHKTALYTLVNKVYTESGRNLLY